MKKAIIVGASSGLKVVKQHPEILITDIRPGFVETPTAKGEGRF